MGWPSAAAVAYNTSVGAFIIPVCLGINLLMLLTTNETDTNQQTALERFGKFNTDTYS